MWSQILTAIAANSRSFSLYAKLGFQVKNFAGLFAMFVGLRHCALAVEIIVLMRSALVFSPTCNSLHFLSDIFSRHGSAQNARRGALGHQHNLSHRLLQRRLTKQRAFLLKLQVLVDLSTYFFASKSWGNLMR